jgi:nitrogen-specific signal transduction histidine kinase
MSRDSDIFRELENDFEATFIRELIPGILHNFANPLNGIMGRSKLLQRRVEENIKKTVEQFPEAGKRFVEDYGKITKDVELMISEADRLFEMFRSVSGKFYAVSDVTVQKVNLSEAVENEMKFSDFYLDFKHQVKKQISLDPDVPEISMAPADLTLLLSSLIRYCMQTMKASAVKEFSISTSCERGQAILRVQDTGASLEDALKASLMKGDVAPSQAPEGSKRLFLAFALLGKYQARIEVSSVDSKNIYVIRIPLQAAGVKKG